MQKLVLFEKEISYVKDSVEKKFPVIKGVAVKTTANGEEIKRYFDIGFKKETKEKLEKEMIKNDLDFPVEINFEDDRYFITEETAKSGYKSLKLVILDYVSINKPEKKPEAKAKITIDDLFN